jgi:hypothetical protein
MKEFRDLKIVGALMLHDDNKYAKMVLDDISKYVNAGIYVNLNDPTSEILDIALKHDNIVQTIETTNTDGRWNQGLQRDNTIRMLDNIKPDIVLFPDSDEIYPDNMVEQLKVFWSDEEKKTFWFRLLYMWDKAEQFRNDGIFKRIHHVRAFKWDENLVYQPKYAGYACPTNYINLNRTTRYNSDKPTFHYGYMHAEDRVRKFARANSDYCNPEVRKKVDSGMLIVNLDKVIKKE